MYSLYRIYAVASRNVSVMNSILIRIHQLVSIRVYMQIRLHVICNCLVILPRVVTMQINLVNNPELLMIFINQYN